MSILDDLKALQQTATAGRQTHPPAGDSYISDAVVYSALYRAGVDEVTINEVLQEPVEARDWFINYFEGKKND